MKKIIIITLIFSAVSLLNGQVSSNDFNQNEKLSIEQNSSLEQIFKFPRFDSRRITGLAYSTFVPGSGQIYLGHKTKGAFFAVSFFAGLVGAVVSQNNFTGNKERIQSLQFDYLNADRFTLAEYYWKQIVSVHNDQKTHERARNIFTALTAAVWVANLVDYVFLTDDKGPIEFSFHSNTSYNSITLFSVSVPLNL